MPAAMAWPRPGLLSPTTWSAGIVDRASPHPLPPGRHPSRDRRHLDGRAVRLTRDVVPHHHLKVDLGPRRGPRTSASTPALSGTSLRQRVVRLIVRAMFRTPPRARVGPAEAAGQGRRRERRRKPVIVTGAVGPKKGTPQGRRACESLSPARAERSAPRPRRPRERRARRHRHRRDAGRLRAARSPASPRTSRPTSRAPGDAFAVVRGMDAVVHAAAIPDPTHNTPATVFQNNIMATFNVLEAAVRFGVSRFVNISSETVPGFFFPERPFLPDYVPVDEEHPIRPAGSLRALEVLRRAAHGRRGAALGHPLHLDPALLGAPRGQLRAQPRPAGPRRVGAERRTSGATSTSTIWRTRSCWPSSPACPATRSSTSPLPTTSGAVRSRRRCASTTATPSRSAPAAPQGRVGNLVRQGGGHARLRAQAVLARLPGRPGPSEARDREALEPFVGTRRAFAGVALVSLATLVLELTLTRLFSATMYYHFAFLAVSLALFGSGASGVVVYLVRPRSPAAHGACARGRRRPLRGQHGRRAARGAGEPALAGQTPRAAPAAARLRSMARPRCRSSSRAARSPWPSRAGRATIEPALSLRPGGRGGRVPAARSRCSTRWARWTPCCWWPPGRRRRRGLRGARPAAVSTAGRGARGRGVGRACSPGTAPPAASTAQGQGPRGGGQRHLLEVELVLARHGAGAA